MLHHFPRCVQMLSLSLDDATFKAEPTPYTVFEFEMEAHVEVNEAEARSLQCSLYYHNLVHAALRLLVPTPHSSGPCILSSILAIF